MPQGQRDPKENLASAAAPQVQNQAVTRPDLSRIARREQSGRRIIPFRGSPEYEAATSLSARPFQKDLMILRRTGRIVVSSDESVGARRIAGRRRLWLSR